MDNPWIVARPRLNVLGNLAQRFEGKVRRQRESPLRPRIPGAPTSPFASSSGRVTGCQALSVLGHIAGLLPPGQGHRPCGDHQHLPRRKDQHGRHTFRPPCHTGGRPGSWLALSRSCLQECSGGPDHCRDETVIIGNPAEDKNGALLRAFARKWRAWAVPAYGL
jgi:hypothetical protein